MNRRKNQRQSEIVGILRPVKYILHTAICSYLLYSKFYPYECSLVGISVLVHMWTNSTNLMINWQSYTENQELILRTESQLLENSAELDQILSLKEMFDIRNAGGWALSDIKMNARLTEEECKRGNKERCQRLEKQISLTDDEMIKEFQSGKDYKEISNEIKADEAKAIQEKKKLEEHLEFFHDEKLELQVDFWKLIYNMGREILILSGYLILLFIELLFTFLGSSKRKLMIFIPVLLASTYYYIELANDDFQRTRQDSSSNRHEKLANGKIKITVDDEVTANLRVLMRHWLFLAHMVIAYFIHVPPEPDLNIKHSLKQDDADQSKIFQYCAQGDVTRLKKVLREHQHSIDINAPKNDGSTPMHLAIEGNHCPVVKILVSNFDGSLNTLVRNGQKHDCLDLAIIKKNKDIFRLILALTPTPNISSLALAVTTNQVHMVKQLIPKIPNQLLSETSDPLTIFCEKSMEYAKSGSNMKKAQKNQAKKNLDFFKEIITRDLQSIRKKNESTDDNISNRGTNDDHESDDENGRDFECPVCYCQMAYPIQIFGCSNDQLICSNCLQDLKKRNGDKYKCTVCREDCSKEEPTRRFTYERIVNKESKQARNSLNETKKQK